MPFSTVNATLNLTFYYFINSACILTGPVCLIKTDTNDPIKLESALKITL
jgi:hypothetical protein